MLSSLLFDIRPIYGADGLALEVAERITEALRGRKAFLRALAETAVLHQTPSGSSSGLWWKSRGPTGTSST